MSSSVVSAPELGHAVDAAVEQAKGGDALRRVIVWVPGRESGRSLERHLARSSGVCNTVFVASRQLALELIPPLERPVEALELTVEVKRELVRTLLVGMPPPLGPSASPVVVREVVRALDLIRTMTDAERQGLSDASALAAELVELYHRFIERAGALHDETSLLVESAGRVSTETPAVIAVKTEEWTPAELELVLALQAAGRLTVLDVQVPEAPPPGELIVAVDADVEVQMVVRRVLAELERGIELDDMAIVVPEGDVYSSLLHEHLKAAGLRWRGRNSARLHETVAGRLAASLVAGMAAEWNREGFLSFIGSAPVSARSGSKAQVDAAEWEARIEASRCGDQCNEMVERLGSLGHRDLCAFIEELRSVAPSSTTSWGDWVERTLQSLTRFLLTTDTADGSVDVRRRVAHLARLDAVSSVVDADTFASAVLDELRRPGNKGGKGPSLFAGTYADIGGATFAIVHACGLGESLTGNGRQQGLLAALMTPGAGEAEAFETTFRSAVAGASRVVLSMSRSDGRSRREDRPSSVLTAVAGHWAGRPVTVAEMLAGDPNEEWLTVVPSFTSMLDPAQVMANSSMQTLAATRSGGLDVIDADHVQRAEQMMAERNSERFTEFDGHTSGVPIEAEMSATSMERWAVCPFKYFLSSVLGIDGEERVDEAWTFKGVDKGNLVHQAMQDLLSHDDLPSTPATPWSEAQRQRLHAIIDARLAEAKEMGRLPRGLLYQHEAQLVHDQLDAVLDEDNRMRAESGTVPQVGGVELSFGAAEGTHVVVERKGKVPVQFRGRIDRVDSSPDGLRKRAFDYKSGKYKGFSAVTRDNPVDGGKHLQLAIYAAAVRRLFPDAERIDSSYWFVADPTASRRVISVDEGEALQEALAGAVDRMASGMEEGVFPAVPGNEQAGTFDNCRSCGFDAICPADRGEAWRRKSSDPATNAFTQLAGAQE